MSSNPKALAMARNRMKNRRENSAGASAPASTPPGSAVFGMASKGVDEYGLDVGRLKQWAHERQRKLVEKEETQQEVAISRMRAFVIQIKHIVRIQSWYRGLVQRWKFREWKFEKDQFRFRYLQGWYQVYKSEKLFRRQLCYRPFIEWAVETKDAIRLSQVAKMIFKKAVDKLKLTPQAVMAFFNQRENQSSNISITEMNKVRRLILKKLYTAWLKENQRLQISRFRAGQVLARVARRIQEKLSPKEFQMISFHLWHRYASVKGSHRRDEKDKAFVTPYIARWPRLLRILNSKRIRNKRTEEKAHKVMCYRALKSWRIAMDKEQADLDNLDLEDKATRHFEDRLCGGVVSAWSALAKERGKNLRRREKCFRAWAQWAPQHREYRGKEDITRAWLVMRRLNDHFRSWMHRADVEMHKRLGRLRKLRSRFFDKNVLTVGYILLGRYGHFFLLDTWQRWKMFVKRRRSWKTVMWKFRMAWMDCKKKAVFLGWKYVTAYGIKKRKGVTKKEYVEQKALTEGDSFLMSFDNMVHQTDYMEDLRRNTALRRSGSGLYTPSYNRKGEAKGGVMKTVAAEGSDEESQHEEKAEEAPAEGEPVDPAAAETTEEHLRPSDMLLHEEPSVVSGLDTASFTEMSNTSITEGDSLEGEDTLGVLGELPRQFTKGFTFSESKSFNGTEGDAEAESKVESTPAVRLSRSMTIIGELKDTTALLPMKATAEAGLALFALAGSGKMDTDQLGPNPTEFMACCRAQATHQGGDLLLWNKPTEGQGGKLQELLETMSVSTMGTVERLTHEHYDTEKLGPCGALALTADEELEEALLPPDVNKAISALLRGARVRAQHVEMVSRRAEDEYLPLLNLLLTESVAYPCTRVFRGDIADQILQCTNPLASAVIGNHVHRWSKASITRREQDTLTEDRALTKYVGCGFQTVVFVRMAVLLLLRARADELEKISGKPAAGVALTEDEEVALVLRRRKISRLWEIEESLTQVIGLDIPPEFSKKDKIDQFRQFDVLTEADAVVEEKEVYVPDTEEIDLRGLLGEQALLLGPLSDDAVAIRNSFMERDDRLLSKGFMKQARKDYLSLQQTFLDDIKQRGEERRDALGIIKPLLGGDEEIAEGVAKQLGGKKTVKSGKKKKGKKSTGKSDGLANDTGAALLDTEDNIPGTAGTEGTDGLGETEEFDEDRPTTAMTDGSFQTPNKPDGDERAVDSGEEQVGSPTKVKMGENDESDDNSDVFSDPDEHMLEEERRKLQSQGGTVIGGGWGHGMLEEPLESTRLDKYNGLIVEAWRPRPKGVLLHSLDAPAPVGKKKKKKEGISASKQREEDKVAERMAKHVLNADIAKQLSKRFVDESASCLNRFRNVLSSIGIGFPAPLKFPDEIIDKTTKPYLLHNKKPAAAKKTTQGSKKFVHTPTTPGAPSAVSVMSPLLVETSPAVVVSVLGPDGNVLTEDKPATGDSAPDLPVVEEGNMPMVSEFFVDAVYNRPQLGLLPKLKTWWWLPRHWWSPNRLHHFLEEEIDMIEGEITKRKAETAEIVKERKELSAQISELREFLQGARNAVLSVGSKSMSEGKILVRQKQAKVRLLTQTKAKIAAKKSKLGDDSALVAKVTNLIDMNEVDQALICMGTESGFSAPGDAEMEKMKTHALDMLSKRAQLLAEETEVMAELADNVRKQEKDIIRFDKQAVMIKGMLKKLALTRFDAVVNVQKHLELQVDQLVAFKKRENEELKRLKKLSDSLIKLLSMSTTYGQYGQDESFRERFRPTGDGKGIRKKMIVNEYGQWEEVLVDDDDSVGLIEADYASRLSKPRKASMLDFGNLLANSLVPPDPEKTPVKTAEERDRELAELQGFTPVDMSNYKPSPLDGSAAWPEWMGDMNEDSSTKKVKKSRRHSIDPVSGKPVIFHTGFSNIEDFKDYSGDSGSDDEGKSDLRHEKHLTEVLMNKRNSPETTAAAAEHQNEEPKKTKKRKKFDKIMEIVNAPTPPVPTSEQAPEDKDHEDDDMSEMTGTNLLPNDSTPMSPTDAKTAPDAISVVTVEVESPAPHTPPPLPNSAARRGSIAMFSKSLSSDLRKFVKDDASEEDPAHRQAREAADALAEEKALLAIFKSDMSDEEAEEEEEDFDAFEDDDYDLEERSADRSFEIDELATKKHKKNKRSQLSAQKLVQLEIEEEKRMKEDQRALEDVPMETIRGDIDAEYWKVLSQIAMMNMNDEPSVVTEESSLSSDAQKELDAVLPQDFAEALERKKRIKRALKARRKSRTGRMYEAVSRDKRIKGFRARLTMMNRPLVEDDVFEELADLFDDPDDLEVVMEEGENEEEEEELDEKKAADAWAPEAYNKNVVVGDDGNIEEEMIADPCPSSVSMLDKTIGAPPLDSSPGAKRRRAVSTVSGRDPFAFPATQWADKYKQNMKSPDKDHLVRPVSSNKPLAETSCNSMINSAPDNNYLDDSSFGQGNSRIAASPDTSKKDKRPTGGKSKKKKSLIGAITESNDFDSLGSDSDNSVHMTGGGDEQALLLELAKSGSFGVNISRKSADTDSENDDKSEHSALVAVETLPLTLPSTQVEQPAKSAVPPELAVPGGVSSDDVASAPGTGTTPKGPVFMASTETAGPIAPISVVAEPTVVSKPAPAVVRLVKETPTPDNSGPAIKAQQVENESIVAETPPVEADSAVDRAPLNSREDSRSARRSVRFTDGETGEKPTPSASGNQHPSTPPLMVRTRSQGTPPPPNFLPAKPGPPSREEADRIMKRPLLRGESTESMNDSITSASVSALGADEEDSVSPFAHFRSPASAACAPDDMQNATESDQVHGDGSAQFNFYRQQTPLKTPQVGIFKPQSPMPDVLSKEEQNIRKEYSQELRKAPASRFGDPVSVLASANDPTISNAAAKTKAKKEANSRGTYTPMMVEAYDQPRSVTSKSTQLLPTGSVRPPLYSHLDPSEFTVCSATTAGGGSDASMRPQPDDQGAASAALYEKAMQRAIDASKCGAFISVSGEALMPNNTATVKSKRGGRKAGKSDKHEPEPLPHHATNNVDDEAADVAILLGGEDLMLKLMKHKDEDSNVQGERITVADVIKGSDAYFSLADFVKMNLGENVAAPAVKKRHSVIQLATGVGKSSSLSPIASLDELSDASSVMSITSMSRHPRNVDNRRKRRGDDMSTSEKSAPQFADSDVEDDDEDEHRNWSKLNMTEEHLADLANNLKDAVLYDSQVASEKEYIDALSSPPSDRNTVTPLLNDRGQLALALRKTFQKFSTHGRDENLETKAKNKKFFLEQFERETARKNFEASKKRVRQPKLKKGSFNDSSSTGSLPRSVDSVGVQGYAPGGIAALSTRDLHTTAKPRVPLVLDTQAAADREGYYTPAVQIYTDEMRLDMEAVKRKPYFDQDGNLVVPPASIDDTLSAGLAGSSVTGKKTPVETKDSPALCSRPMSPMDELRVLPPSPKAALTNDAPIQPNVPNPGMVDMFRGESGDGAIPLPFDLDNDFFIRSGSAPKSSINVDTDRRRKLLNKHLKSAGDERQGDGEPISSSSYDYFILDEGEGEVYDAYRTLLDIKANKQSIDMGDAALPVEEPTVQDPTNGDEEIGNTYRLFQQSDLPGDEASSQGSHSLPYPYPFPSTMYDTMPAPRSSAVEFELQGQPIPLYYPPQSQMSNSRGMSRSRVREEALGGRSQDSLSRPPVADYSPVSPPPPFWNPLPQPGEFDIPSPRAQAADDDSRVSHASSVSGELITPVGITQAVVSVSSTRSKPKSANERRMSPSGDQAESFPLHEFNQSSISTAGADFDNVVDMKTKTNEDYEAEMEAELRRMLRGEPPANAPDTAGVLYGEDEDSFSLPKISMPIKAHHSTTALSLVNPTSRTAMNSLNAGKKLSNRKSTGGLTKLNTFSRTISETKSPALAGSQLESHRLTGNKMSSGLMSAGSASFGKLGGLRMDGAHLSVSRSNNRL